MPPPLPKSFSRTAYTGLAAATGYVYCEFAWLERPGERAVLVAIHIGLAAIAKCCIDSWTGTTEKSIKKQEPWLRGRVVFLSEAAHLLALPLTLLIGRKLKFNVPDYVHLAGLIWIINKITVLSRLAMIAIEQRRIY